MEVATVTATEAETETDIATKAGGWLVGLAAAWLLCGVPWWHLCHLKLIAGNDREANSDRGSGGSSSGSNCRRICVTLKVNL